MSIRIGSIVKSKKVCIGSPSQGGEFEYAANRGKMFLSIVIGVVDKDNTGEEVDAEAVLNSIGWYRKEDNDVSEG